MAVADIGHKDLGWGVAATIFKMGAGIFLYPFILNILPSDTVAIWTVFTTINMLALQLDLGFNQSFTRNISYVFSGVEDLKTIGYYNVDNAETARINYNLLKSTIKAMHFFYSRMAFILLILLLSIGSLYIWNIADMYAGSRVELFASWIVSCGYNCFMLYTMYYESMVSGKGLIKRMNQILICGNICYIILAVVLLQCNCGLFAIVSAQLVSVVIIRLLSKRIFFDAEIVLNLSKADDSDYKSILSKIWPNAFKVGLTSIGGFIINRAGLLLGTLYISLTDMASYGITMQIVTVICYISTIYTRVYLPKVFQWRVEKQMLKVQHTYNMSNIVLWGIFILSGVGVVLFGNPLLSVLKCKTLILPASLTILIWIQNALESNHCNASQYLLARNEVPFFKASLISAAGTIVLLLIFVLVFKWGILGLILAPTIAQAVYQNWRWPLMVVSEFKSYNEK